MGIFTTRDEITAILPEGIAESRAAGTRPDLSYVDLTDTILRGTRLPVEEH